MTDSDSTELDVLLVEDNPGDRDLILEYLEQSGRAFQTETAGSLASAFEILNDKMFNAVFLDLGLPDSIGLDTLQRFISDSPGVPVIVLTGLDDEQLGIDAIRIGAQDYLVKGKVNTNHHRAVRAKLIFTPRVGSPPVRSIPEMTAITPRAIRKGIVLPPI